MQYVILDLEWDNSFFSRPEIKLNEIIEFGAVKFDEELNIIGEFSTFVKPKLTRFISNRTKRLTHITSEMLQTDGKPYAEALEDFKAFLGDCVLMTWSTSDIITLMDNHKYHFGTDILDYIDKYINVQRYCEVMLNSYDKAKQMGLTRAAEMLEINYENIEHHRALDDSLLALECLRKLYDKDKLAEFISDAKNPSFYQKLTYKPTIIVDLNSPQVDKTKMFFNCEKCGATSKKKNKKKKWKLKGRFFYNTFVCSKCGYEFIGKIQFKQLFDKVEVKKKTAPKTEAVVENQTTTQEEAE